MAANVFALAAVLFDVPSQTTCAARDICVICQVSVCQNTSGSKVSEPSTSVDARLQLEGLTYKHQPLLGSTRVEQRQGCHGPYKLFTSWIDGVEEGLNQNEKPKVLE